MEEKRFIFTSESVTEGHPDKICDQVSDAILDEIISKDKHGRVAVESMTTRGVLIVVGEITTDCYVEIPDIVRDVIKNAGYTNPAYGMDYESVAVLTSIQEQAKDIAIGVDTGGAGDQGMMFGFAIDETPEYMPMPIMLAHKLVKRLAEVRKNKILDYLRPDGKSQVTIEYRGGKPYRVEAVVLSAQHDPDISIDELRDDLYEHVIEYVLKKENIKLDEETKYFINPTGRFVIGGPQADSGVTGRKIMVDTYGGYARHGGGCFSGKDPTKVDRSAAYMARYLAKNIVAAGIAKKCEIQLAYAIGVPKPVAIFVDTFKTGKVPDERIIEFIKNRFDLSPRGIIEYLELLQPIYRRTACYGHFGREEEGFSWEKLDVVSEFKELLD
ncbi:MAG: methionine adenosyltransferase [candidate division WOR-3 bacterium]|uniref:S-adenosylmethionine synthase n=1 Tax=candidate division WOR-3 bacterium TaxID=2052148 RepID=A0A7V4ABL4_UNCW3